MVASWRGECAILKWLISKGCVALPSVSIPLPCMLLILVKFVLVFVHHHHTVDVEWDPWLLRLFFPRPAISLRRHALSRVHWPCRALPQCTCPRRSPVSSCRSKGGHEHCRFRRERGIALGGERGISSSITDTGDCDFKRGPHDQG